jgi:hypothetical protein
LRTISEFIFELVQNSVEAGSKTIRVTVDEDLAQNMFSLTIEDDGGGVKAEHLPKLTSPFFTTRPHGRRKVGLGLSLMDAACQQCGGQLKIDSEYRRGTTLVATMEHDNIDRPPLGDLADVYASLMMSTVENGIIWILEHKVDGEGYGLKNRKTMDELNILTFAEAGARDKLYRLIMKKEKKISP